MKSLVVRLTLVTVSFLSIWIILKSSHDTYPMETALLFPDSVPSPAVPTESYFQKAVAVGVQALTTATTTNNNNNTTTTNRKRRSFDVKQWKQRTTGGLVDQDRILLAAVYSQAESVFEFGLGESTYIADYVGVPYYAGIDSDAEWVSQTRAQVNTNFRFYFADIGPTKYWGYPDAPTAKGFVQYQLAPLLAEQRPFDVYMVDGRWRVPTTLLCFLHASDRGADHQHTTVLLHDCPLQGVTPEGIYRRRYRVEYERVNEVLDRVQHSGGVLCVYKRKKNTTDEMLWNLWLEVHDDVI